MQAAYRIRDIILIWWQNNYTGMNGFIDAACWVPIELLPWFGSENDP